jgi:hypothetical protein
MKYKITIRLEIEEVLKIPGTVRVFKVLFDFQSEIVPRKRMCGLVIFTDFKLEIAGF